ncbi:hypothetical protein BDF14DRAFT_525088 [Spinellus fusiger]|nr:hypothetical protein BDF14DRAFT_525088 [Spinellus fusiger]
MSKTLGPRLNLVLLECLLKVWMPYYCFILTRYLTEHPSLDNTTPSVPSNQAFPFSSQSSFNNPKQMPSSSENPAPSSMFVFGTPSSTQAANPVTPTATMAKEALSKDTPVVTELTSPKPFSLSVKLENQGNDSSSKGNSVQSSLPSGLPSTSFTFGTSAFSTKATPTTTEPSIVQVIPKAIEVSSLGTVDSHTKEPQKTPSAFKINDPSKKTPISFGTDTGVSSSSGSASGQQTAPQVGGHFNLIHSKDCMISISFFKDD